MKEKIRDLICRLGADVCGFSSIERFDDAPAGFNPRDLFPSCQTVIVFGIALPFGLIKVKPRLIYAHFNNDVTHRVDALAFEAAKKIELEWNATSVPVPCDGPYEYWNETKSEGKGLLSMKHAAVNAGLGDIGKSSLFLHKTYGNRLTLGAILCDLELSPDELSEELCPEHCHTCIDSCPVSAIQQGKVLQDKCRANTYGKTARGFDTVNCNRCRTCCPVGRVHKNPTFH